MQILSARVRTSWKLPMQKMCKYWMQILSNQLYLMQPMFRWICIDWFSLLSLPSSKLQQMWCKSLSMYSMHGNIWINQQQMRKVYISWRQMPQMRWRSKSMPQLSLIYSSQCGLLLSLLWKMLVWLLLKLLKPYIYLQQMYWRLRAGQYR